MGNWVMFWGNLFVYRLNKVRNAGIVDKQHEHKRRGTFSNKPSLWTDRTGVSKMLEKLRILQFTSSLINNICYVFDLFFHCITLITIGLFHTFFHSWFEVSILHTYFHYRFALQGLKFGQRDINSFWLTKWNVTC